MLDKDRQLLINKMKESMNSLNIKKRVEEKVAEEKRKEDISNNALPKIISDLKKFKTIYQDSVNYNEEKYSFTAKEFTIVVNKLFDSNKAKWKEGSAFPYGEMIYKYEEVYLKICLLIGQGSTFTIILLEENK